MIFEDKPKEGPKVAIVIETMERTDLNETAEKWKKWFKSVDDAKAEREAYIVEHDLTN